MRASRWVLALGVLATACTFEAQHGTGYKCVEDADCPDGQACVDLVCGGAMSAFSDGDPGGDADGGGGGLADAGLPNIVANWGFESSNLEDWHEYNSMVDRTGDARSGSYAGRVCPTEAAFFTAYQFLFREDTPTGTYSARVYARADGAPLAMRVTIRENFAEGDVNHDGESVDVGDAWTLLETSAEVTRTDHDWIQIIVWGLTNESDCYLLDDAVVTVAE